MLSFKPFLYREETTKDAGDVLAAQQRLISSLLEGMVIHAIRGEAEDYRRFETDIRSLRESLLSGSLQAAEIAVLASSALRALQDYNRRTNSSVYAQSVELQKITLMLTGAIASLSSEGSINVSRLHLIEKQLEQTASLDDLRQIKHKLNECITALREEKQRQKAATESTVSRLNESLRTMHAASPSKAVSLDASTGLGTRPSGENAIAAAADGTVNSYAALFVIDHLHGSNRRFGREVGDQIIMMFAQHLAQKLEPLDGIFRWSGPAFLAIVERDADLDTVRRSFSPITNAKLEITVEARGRSVLLPVNFSWTLIPVPANGVAASVVEKLDAFLATKSNGEA